MADASEQPGAGDAVTPGEVVTIKKYANRRLYNTSTSSYVTLEHLSEMVRENVDFVVLDAKSGDDITRSVLTQIIFEQESRGQSMLPVQFLRRLIRFYGDSMQSFLPPYLEMSMETFSKSHDQFREQFSRAFGGAKTPIAAFEEQARQNMALFQNAISMWNPAAAAAATAAQRQPSAPVAKTEVEAAADEAQITELRKQVEAMQRQLDAMSSPRKP